MRQKGNRPSVDRVDAVVALRRAYPPLGSTMQREVLDPVETLANGSQEGLEMTVQFLRANAEVPIEQGEELPLHGVHCCKGETEMVVAMHGAVASPEPVLRRRVIQVLCGEDEGREEDAVDRTALAFGRRRQTDS